MVHEVTTLAATTLVAATGFAYLLLRHLFGRPTPVLLAAFTVLLIFGIGTQARLHGDNHTRSTNHPADTATIN